MRRYTIESFPYIWVLLLLYAAYYGAILVYSGGLPYVMDANESFSVFWHSYNLLHFDITQSFGLTDEAYGFSATAHPYLHTHQGNMPRLFGALIYVLGARSIEAQIVVTTAVIGTATVMFAFFAMRRLASPLFAFIFTALLLTDYLQFAQWNVVTYRVWYGFLFFAILLSIMRAGEPQGRWAMAALFGAFALLFYNELVFAGLMAIIGGLFTAYWHRQRTRLVIKLCIIEIAGAATAIAIFLTQLLSKFGLDVVKQDFATTFLMRNLSNDVEQQQAAIDFFNEHGIVFWSNFVDSSSLRNLAHFVRLQTIYIFQLYTPWLTLLTAVVLGGFVLSVASDKRFSADLAGWRRDFQLSALTKGRCQLLAAMVLVLTLAVPGGTRFGSADIALGLAAGVAAAYFVWAAAARWNLVRWRDRIAVMRDPDLAIVIQVLAFAMVGFFLFSRPTSFVFVSRIALAASVCALCLVHGPSWQFGPILQRWSLTLRKLSAPYVAHVFGQWKVWLPTAFGMVLLLLFIRVGIEAAVFGIKPQSGSNNFSLLGIGLAFLFALIVTRVLSGLWIEPAKPRALTVCLLLSFPAVVAVFINYQWRLYDQDFSILWTLPFRYPGIELLERLLALASVFLGGSLIALGWRHLVPVRQAKALVDPLALLVIGEIALLAIFYLSPGYVLTGYLKRTAPFTVFFTSLPIAAMFYLVAVIGGRAHAAARRLARRSRLPVKRSLASCLTAPRLAAGLVASGLLVALSLYWVALQGAYVRMLPPNHFAILKELRKPPFAGKSAVLNTYAAPVATMTGQWAYFDGIVFMNLLHRADHGYVLEQDMRNYLWLADRDTNPEYRRPDYFICLWPQSLSSPVADRGQGFSYLHNICLNMPIVVAAKKSTGLMRHQLIAADPSPRGSWAIIKLDHELPPLAQAVTATLVPAKDGLTVEGSYRYLQPDGTPEGATVIELLGERAARDCVLSEKAEILAAGNAGDVLSVPRDFSGTIALRVTPVSVRKAGEGTLSNKFVFGAGARHVTACPLDLTLNFRDPNIWRKHAAAGLNPPGPAGSVLSGRRGELLIDAPSPARGVVEARVAMSHALGDRGLLVTYEVNGERYGPFRIDSAETTVEHAMRIPAAVFRREVPVAISISIDGAAEINSVALQELTFRENRDEH